MKLIAKVKVAGFRSISDADLDKLGDINIIIGPNNCGKSSVLKALGKLRELKATPDFRFTGSDLVSEEAVRSKVAQAYEGKDDVRPLTVPFPPDEMRHGADYADFVFTFNPSVTNQFMQEEVGDSIDTAVLKYLRATGRNDTDDATRRLFAQYCEIWFRKRESLIEPVLMRFSWFCFKRLAADLAARIIACEDGRLQSYAGKAIETYVAGIPSFGSEHYVALRDWLRTVVDKRIAEYLPNVHKVRMDTGYDASMGDLGSGVRALVCLAADIIASPNPSVVIIDEPELGLNPLAKQRLLDLIWDQSDRKQFFIATHDPTFTNPVLWRGRSAKRDVQVYAHSGFSGDFKLVNRTESHDTAGSFAGYLPHTTSPKEIHVYVEGRHDAQVLREFLSKHLWERKRWEDLEDRIGVYHCGGDYWPHLLGTLPVAPYKRLLILDGDKRAKLAKLTGDPARSECERIQESYADEIEFWEEKQLREHHADLVATMRNGLRTPVYILARDCIEKYLKSEPECKGHDPRVAHAMTHQEIPEELKLLLDCVIESMPES